jgi:hypothetical protein
MLALNANQAEIPLPDGSYGSGWVVSLAYTDAEMADLLSRYEPTSGTSPSVSDARPTTRTVLNAVLAAQPA